MSNQEKRIAILFAVGYSTIMIGLIFLIGWTAGDSLGHLLLYSAEYIVGASILIGLGIPVLSRLLDRRPPSNTE